MSFDELFEQHSWRPIYGCPGRFVLRGGPSTVSPEDLAGQGAKRSVRRTDSREDAVVIIRFPGGGLLSYEKPDARFIHTLNTEDGLARKMKMLGLSEQEFPENPEAGS